MEIASLIHLSESNFRKSNTEFVIYQAYLFITEDKDPPSTQIYTFFSLFHSLKRWFQYSVLL